MSQHRKAIFKNHQQENTVCYDLSVAEGWKKLENALKLKALKSYPSKSLSGPFCGCFLSKTVCIKLLYSLSFFT